MPVTPSNGYVSMQNIYMYMFLAICTLACLKLRCAQIDYCVVQIEKFVQVKRNSGWQGVLMYPQ